MNIEKGYKYSRTDEWVKVDGDVATIGITDYAQDHLSDIVYVEFLSQTGSVVKKNSAIVSIESVKAAAEVNAPVSGKIVELNESLPSETGLLNSDPFGKAWILKISIENPSELDELMDSAAYEKYCSERGS